MRGGTHGCRAALCGLTRPGNAGALMLGSLARIEPLPKDSSYGGMGMFRCGSMQRRTSVRADGCCEDIHPMSRLRHYLQNVMIIVDMGFHIGRAARQDSIDADASAR